MTEGQGSAKRRGLGKPFAPGVSGNPGGRPKELEDVKAAAREHTQAAIARLAHWMESEEPRASVAAATALLDRAWGKPQQSLDVDLKVDADLAGRLEAARARRRIANAG